MPNQQLEPYDKSWWDDPKNGPTISKYVKLRQNWSHLKNSNPAKMFNDKFDPYFKQTTEPGYWNMAVNAAKSTGSLAWNIANGLWQAPAEATNAAMQHNNLFQLQQLVAQNPQLAYFYAKDDPNAPVHDEAYYKDQLVENGVNMGENAGWTLLNFLGGGGVKAMAKSTAKQAPANISRMSKAKNIGKRVGTGITVSAPPIAGATTNNFGQGSPASPADPRYNQETPAPAGAYQPKYLKQTLSQENQQANAGQNNNWDLTKILNNPWMQVGGGVLGGALLGRLLFGGTGGMLGGGALGGLVSYMLRNPEQVKELLGWHRR